MIEYYEKAAEKFKADKTGTEVLYRLSIKYSLMEFQSLRITMAKILAKNLSNKRVMSRWSELASLAT